MHVSLECPHCHAQSRTRQIVVSGAMVRCPQCGQPFRLLPDEAGLVETIPVVGDRSSRLMDDDPMPRTSPSKAEETPTPRTTSPEAVTTTATKPPRFSPFERSRTTVASFLLIVIFGLIGLFLYWYVTTVRSLDRTATEASRQRVARVENLATGKGAGTVRVGDEGTDRTIAPATLQIGDVVVGISGAEIAPIRVNNRESSTLYLIFTVRVTNLSTKPLPFVGWHAAGTLFTLRDTSKNYYNRIKFTESEMPHQCVQRTVIQPGETIKDMLVFENPAIHYTSFELDLGLGSSTYQFFVPGMLVKKAAPTPPPQQFVPFTPPPPPPPAPVPAEAPPPAKEPTVAEQILDEYTLRWAEVERVARTKGYNRALEYRRAKKQEIITHLAKKYNVTRPDVKSIIPP